MPTFEAKPLGAVCTIKPPKSEAKAKVGDDDEVSFGPMEDLGIGVKYFQPVRTRRFADVRGSYTYFADGDVLLAKITPCFENGKLGVARGLKNGVGFGSSEYIVLRPTPELDAEFLYYYLTRPAFLEEGARTMTGAVGHKRVTKEFVESYSIPLPPLALQRRTVAILDKAFEAIATAKANAEKNLLQARELFDSHLASVFSNTHNLVPLTELASDITDGDHMPPPKASAGIPFITISNIVKRTRSINFDSTFLVSPEYFGCLKPNRKPRRGDILYTVTGATLGIPVLVDHDTQFCFQRHIALIRPRPGINSRWLSYAMSSPQVFRQATTGATGAAQKTVSLTLLRSIRVPRCPESEQIGIAARLDDLFSQTFKLEELYRARVAALAELKQALLHRAFSGQVSASTVADIRAAVA